MILGVELRKATLAINVKDSTFAENLISPRNVNQTSIRNISPTTEVITVCKIQGFDEPIKTSLDLGSEMNVLPKGLIIALGWAIDDKLTTKLIFAFRVMQQIHVLFH